MTGLRHLLSGGLAVALSIGSLAIAAPPRKGKPPQVIRVEEEPEKDEPERGEEKAPKEQPPCARAKPTPDEGESKRDEGAGEEPPPSEEPREEPAPSEEPREEPAPAEEPREEPPPSEEPAPPQPEPPQPAPPAPPRVEVRAPKFIGGGSVPGVRTVLRRTKQEVSACVAKHGGLGAEAGTLEVQFLVRARGRAEGVEVLSHRAVGAGAARCVRKMLKHYPVGRPTADPVGVIFVYGLERVER